MTPEQRAAIAIRVKALLDSEDVQAAFAECEAEIVSEWKRTVWPWRQRMKWNELRGLQRLRDRLTSYARHVPRN